MLTKANSSWINTGLGYGTNVTAYGGFKRNWVDRMPSLKCPNNNDKFTMSSTLGNGKLTYPVALITSDEIAYAGGSAYNYNTSSYIANTEFYLHTPSYYYWTLTPWAFAGGDSREVGWGMLQVPLVLFLFMVLITPRVLVFLSHLLPYLEETEQLIIHSLLDRKEDLYL